MYWMQMLCNDKLLNFWTNTLLYSSVHELSFNSLVQINEQGFELHIKYMYDL